ncbi:MAG: aminoacyl-tRNA hydrolase [Armatimonadota bacterium]|nr:aminoacyl-tRNA hydrolase [Armatimonadota bacterium]
MKLIVGIGNPGRRYARTRHNVGFDVIDLLAKAHHIRVLRRCCRALIGQGVVAGQEVVMVKPQTYVNLSGGAVAELARRYGAGTEDVLVIVDDADLPVGRIRIRTGGSSGGHKGLKSIIDHLRTQEFPRIRIGIGTMRGDAVDYVLSKFSRADQPLIRSAMRTAAEAVEMLLAEGIEPAMNKYNRAPDADTIKS